MKAEHWMAPSTRIGNSMRRGFTLIELLLVLFIVAVLASLVGPAVSGGIQRARESTLREDLRVVRKAIDDYYADNGAYPPDLRVLVEKRYLRGVPVDPISGRHDTWTFETEQSKDNDEKRSTGVRDIRSGAEGQGRDGTSFSDW
jgi:prepilin-type N-terminal cleavage/methylation domain-containing protein